MFSSKMDFLRVKLSLSYFYYTLITSLIRPCVYIFCIDDIYSIIQVFFYSAAHTTCTLPKYVHKRYCTFDKMVTYTVDINPNDTTYISQRHSKTFGLSFVKVDTVQLFTTTIRLNLHLISRNTLDRSIPYLLLALLFYLQPSTLFIFILSPLFPFLTLPLSNLKWKYMQIDEEEFFLAFPLSSSTPLTVLIFTEELERTT